MITPLESWWTLVLAVMIILCGEVFGGFAEAAFGGEAKQVIFWVYNRVFSFRRSRLGRGGLLARSLSGGPPGSAGGSRPLLTGTAEFLAAGVTGVPSSSC